MNAMPYNVQSSKLSNPKVDRFDIHDSYNQIPFHKGLQIVLIEEGRGTLFFLDKVIPYKKGDLYFLGRNLSISFEPEKQAHGEIRYSNSKGISLFFDQDKIKKSLHNVPEAHRINRLIDLSDYGLKVSQDSAKYLIEYIDELTESIGLKRFLLFLKFLDVVSKDTNVMILSSKTAPKYIGNENDPKIGKICEFVKKNHRETITLKKIADMANMSPTGFCRFFKSRTQKTFSQYLAEVRIANACELLNNKKYKISDCCYASGYNNLSNFHKHFKKNTGMSPSEYRLNCEDNKRRDAVGDS